MERRLDRKNQQTRLACTVNEARKEGSTITWELSKLLAGRIVHWIIYRRNSIRLEVKFQIREINLYLT
jgi:hypothetical protein